ncbi:MAG: hypothetical protein HY598_03550 [Candidatus Omnitrophica bacterium]|nr:hypothetical protein [Candidatus Omnitrophota bacterium]
MVTCQERRVRLIMAAAVLLAAAWCPVAWALQRAVKTKLHNYPNAPVEIKRSEITLVETFASPTQANSEASTRRSQIRYANRDGLAPSSFMLQGRALCVNRAAQPVAAFALTIVALDAFHQPIQLPGRRGVYAVQQVVASLPRGGSKEITWQVAAGSSEVYEVAVVVTRVRFADESLWVAPGEELVDIF